MAGRCEHCDIDFPGHKRICEACGIPLAEVADRAPDPDWRERVNQRGGRNEEIRVVGWRCHQLIAAGFDAKAATVIAGRFYGPEQIDLHYACDLVAKVVRSGRPVELAYEILR
jgi:hypothetical protein